MKSSSLLIINPISGTRRKDDIAPLLEHALAGRDIALEVAFTQGPGDAAVMARRAAADGFGSVVAAGGDGTVREIASALVGTSTAMGIIPCGSGNGLARTLDIPQDFARSIEIIAKGNTLLCDYGVAAGNPFFCTFGLGFDAAVTEKFASSKRRGRMSYVQSAFQEYLSYTPQAYGLEINGQVITRKAFLIAVCNASQYGNNAYIAPQASLSDGLLDVVVVHRGNTLSEALGAMDLLTGNLDKNTLIETFRVPKVSISRLSDGPAQVDGELIELGRVIDVQCRPAALRMIAPEEIPEFKPVVTPLLSMVKDARYDLLNFLHNLGFY